MKFLVDAQLPKSLSDFLNWKGFDSIHTLELPLKNRTSDKDIILFAANQNRIVITKDVDFLDAHLLLSSPDKLIIVKTGNIPNILLIDIFNKNLDLIIKLISNSNLIEIGQGYIADHKKE